MFSELISSPVEKKKEVLTEFGWKDKIHPFSPQFMGFFYFSIT